MMLEQDGTGDFLESECRDQLADRIVECNDEFCPPCVARCTSPTLEALAGTVKCTVGSSYNGLIWLREVSDQGQLIKALHGAIRSTGYDAVPERRALHEFKQFSWNPRAIDAKHLVLRETLVARGHLRIALPATAASWCAAAFTWRAADAIATARAGGTRSRRPTCASTILSTMTWASPATMPCCATLPPRVTLRCRARPGGVRRPSKRPQPDLSH